VDVKGQTYNPIVVVYLDKEGGIGIDTLAQANKWIDVALDELISTRYTLEVSSPGGRSRRELSTIDTTADKAPSACDNN
jgi:ribosome maturation factor RimP